MNRFAKILENIDGYQILVNKEVLEEEDDKYTFRATLSHDHSQFAKEYAYDTELERDTFFDLFDEYEGKKFIKFMTPVIKMMELDDLDDKYPYEDN
jgi:hypothetical protein